MTLYDANGRPVVRHDSTPAAPDGPFVLTLDDPDLIFARTLTDNPVVQQALAANIVELVCRQFGQGVGPSNQRKRGLVPQFLMGEQTYVLKGDGTRTSFSEPIDEETGNDQGSILYRGQSLWRALGPSAVNYLLETMGVDENPVWARGPGAIPVRLRVFEGGATNITSTFAVLDGTSYLDIVFIGAGGGGGQANASTASNISFGNAGGGGAACRHIITAPLPGYLYLLGAYGGNAQAGTTSTLTIPSPGTDLSVPGGGAGSTVGNSNTLNVAGATNGAVAATGGSVWNRGGKPSSPSIRFDGTTAFTGRGGVSTGYGVGGKGRNTSGVGEIGHGYGGGGSGGLAMNGAGAQAGGHGAPAALIVVEYAPSS